MMLQIILLLTGLTPSQLSFSRDLELYSCSSLLALCSRYPRFPSRGPQESWNHVLIPNDPSVNNRNEPTEHSLLPLPTDTDSFPPPEHSISAAS